MIRRPPRSTPIKSSAASDVYKRQIKAADGKSDDYYQANELIATITTDETGVAVLDNLSLIHISEPTRP